MPEKMLIRATMEVEMTYPSDDVWEEAIAEDIADGLWRGCKLVSDTPRVKIESWDWETQANQPLSSSDIQGEK